MPGLFVPLLKSATHETAAKPTVLAHATSPFGHADSAAAAIAVQLSSPALPGCTLVAKGPPQTVRFADGTEPGDALKLPKKLKSHRAIVWRNGELDGEGDGDGVPAALPVPEGVAVAVGVPAGEPDGLGETLGVALEDEPALGLPLAVGAALGVGVGESGRPAMTTLSMRNVEVDVGSCEKRQQKAGASDALAGSAPVAKPVSQPEPGSDAFGAAPA